MDEASVREELKRAIVLELNLEGKSPSDIGDDAPLFGSDAGGLGLDSLDALQLAMAVEERFGVQVPEGDEARRIFRSARALAQYIVEARASRA